MDSRTLLGSWDAADGDFRSSFGQSREQWLYGFFGGPEKTPPFIWRVEFRRHETGKAAIMVVHRYATHPEKGGRYMTWVKAYNERGEPVSTRLVATVEPEEHFIAELPSQELLLCDLG